MQPRRILLHLLLPAALLASSQPNKSTRCCNSSTRCRYSTASSTTCTAPSVTGAALLDLIYYSCRSIAWYACYRYSSVVSDLLYSSYRSTTWGIRMALPTTDTALLYLVCSTMTVDSPHEVSSWLQLLVQLCCSWSPSAIDSQHGVKADRLSSSVPGLLWL
jgi:hypothetical protein